MPSRTRPEPKPTREWSSVVTGVLKRYPVYKDSGVAWQGKVPEHWNVERVASVADLRVSNVDKHRRNYEFPVRLCNYVDVYKNDRIAAGIPFMRATATAAEIAKFRLVVGDVLLTKDSEDWTDIGVPTLVKYAADDLVCGYHLAILRPQTNVLEGSYLFRALSSHVVAWQFQVAAAGVTRFGLSLNGIRSVRIPLPPLPEQRVIARYLNHADRRIQRYIRAKERLIELLEERKRALIHGAVTGRIDVRTGQPYPIYKDSGVEWLGRVPEHWDVRRNVWLFHERNETGFGLLPILEVSIRDGVRLRDMDGGQRKQQIVDRSRYKRAQKGDIAYNTMRMWQGAVGVVPVDGLVSPAYVIANPAECVESRYYGYLFRTRTYKNAVKLSSRGIVSDRDRLYWDDFKCLPSLVPPHPEQAGIVRFLAVADRRIRRQICATRRLITLLHEYRTRLIADVVTGKLDVRAAAASLPETDPLTSDRDRSGFLPTESNLHPTEHDTSKEAVL